VPKSFPMSKANSNIPLPTNIGAPATRALTAAGITHLAQLAKWSEADLLNLHGVGPKAIRILKEVLVEQRLSFAAPKAKPTAAKVETIDDYLATVSDENRAALQKLREMIKSVVPKASECFSYGLPAFKLDGKLIAGFGAVDRHCSYYPMSGSVIETLKDDLVKYETRKGTLHFPANKPLPLALVRKLIKTRMTEAFGK